MWYGLATQAAKDEAEAFSNRRNNKRLAERLAGYAAKAAIDKARQAAKDEATWKEMKRSWGRSFFYG